MPLGPALCGSVACRRLSLAPVSLAVWSPAAIIAGMLSMLLQFSHGVSWFTWQRVEEGTQKQNKTEK